MATIIIDNKPYSADPEKNLLETAISVGLDLPYFCWHPALGSVGSCRQCAVQQFTDDQDKNGRLVMACMTQIKDGMRFSIDHPTCTSFRKNIIEWLMINHPHDCPVCDEGGECHLQDMTLMTGHNERRYRFKKRTFRNQNLGPFINHEMNRCITCYRCVRFYKDVAGGDDLSAFASSGRVYFGRFQEGPLESAFSGNLVEVCPTGVFTDKVYHKRYVRKWDLETAPSICQLCSVGCNISPGERGSVLRRVQNRFHPDINGYFICDLGRFGHEFVNAKERIKWPEIKKNGVLTKVSLEEAKNHMNTLLKNSARTVGIGSARASLEANWILKQWVSADHFYDGLSSHETSVVSAAFSVLESKKISSASQDDIRKSDCIVIIGEDVMNTAPITSLSVRQAAYGFKQQRSHTDLGIPEFNDVAIRDYARDCRLPIFIAHAYKTAIDDLAESSCIVHPRHLPQLAYALLLTLTGQPMPQDLDEGWQSWVMSTKNALLKSKRPVIITGGSLGESQLVEIASSLVHALDEVNDSHTKLSLVLPEANSIGLAMLRPKSLATLVDDKEPIDVALVLENDVKFRLGSRPFKKLLGRIKHLVVVDSLLTDTAKSASVVFPCLTFAESTGSLVSGEGRLQRYYSVFKSMIEAESSFRTMVSLMDHEAQNAWRTIDDVSRAMSKDVDGLSFGVFEDHNFKILGRGIPRQTSEWSGRTALTANISVHEKKPPVDPDSPFTYSMEGYRKKIPLPLISSYWEPRWNSIQSSFKKEMNFLAGNSTHIDGIRLFSKNNFKKETDRIDVKKSALPSMYVVPRHHLFTGRDLARFSETLLARIPEVYAIVAEEEAEKIGISAHDVICVSGQETQFIGKVVIDNIPKGIVVLPFGLVDASLFYEACSIKVVGEENL